MNILKQKLIFFNRTVTLIPPKIRNLYTVGFWALSLQRISSVRGNMRQLVNNPNTAKTNAWRLLKNKTIAQSLPTLLPHFTLVSPGSIVALVFSDFHGWQILTFAVQTHQGRAVPVYFEIIRYPIQKDSQNIFVVSAIGRFVKLVGCRPKLVMDRGFACPHIIKYLADLSHPFVVRVKGIKQFRNWQNRLFKARNTSKSDQLIYGYYRRLRLVVSDKLSGMKEPWYLVTNDVAGTREEVVTDYDHRFEIEEFFKDAKWLVGLEHLRLKTKRGMVVLLWFVVLGMWFTELLRQLDQLPDWKKKDQLSFNRYVFEQLQLATNQLVFQWLEMVCMGGRKEVVTV